jgi:hypothetical protein
MKINMKQLKQIITETILTATVGGDNTWENTIIKNAIKMVIDKESISVEDIAEAMSAIKNPNTINNTAYSAEILKGKLQENIEAIQHKILEAINYYSFDIDSNEEADNYEEIEILKPR